MPIELDRYTVALLILRPDAPQLDEEAAARLQDAHMAHLADLHDAGHLVAAGPLLDERFRGLSILNVDPDEARRLKEADPAVKAGRFSVQIIPWLVPKGAVTFAAVPFPRSAADVRGVLERDDCKRAGCRSGNVEAHRVDVGCARTTPRQDRSGRARDQTLQKAPSSFHRCSSRTNRIPSTASCVKAPDSARRRY